MYRARRTPLRSAAVCAAVVLGLVAAAAGPAAARSAVSGLRIGIHPDMTRLVLDMSEAVDYRIFTLADPYRVVIDMPEVAWKVPETGPAEGRGAIEGYRYGLFKPGTWRVVLDVAAPVRVKRAFFLEPTGKHRYRFVVDLEKVTREAFLSALKAPPALPAPEPKPVPPPRPGKPVVVLDPGHGGVDPGAISPSGIKEKHLTLKMAREVKRQLEATGRYHVVLTRETDIFLRLRDRVDVARRAGADLFLSLHADTIQNRRVRGLSVYTLSETASDKEAEALAARENKADIIAGIDLSNEAPEVMNILIDLAQRETMNLSANLAEFMITELRREVKVLKKTHRFAGFAVLKAPDVPSALVELGYLSNREEERLLRDPAYRAGLAKAVVRAVDRYLSWKQALTRS